MESDVSPDRARARATISAARFRSPAAIAARASDATSDAACEGPSSAKRSAKTITIDTSDEYIGAANPPSPRRPAADGARSPDRAQAPTLCCTPALVTLQREMETLSGSEPCG